MISKVLPSVLFNPCIDIVDKSFRLENPLRIEIDGKFSIRFSVSDSTTHWPPLLSKFSVVWTTKVGRWKICRSVHAKGPRRPGTTMKRKRGPAPDGRQSRAKRQEEKQVEDSGDLNEESGDDKGSFEGFSDGEEEEALEGQDESKQSGIAVNGNLTKPKQRGKKAAPTQEELMESLFRSSSFQSNLFKLQVDELLSEIRVKYEKMERVEKVLHQLKDIVNLIPDSQEQLVFPISIETKGSYMSTKHL